MSGAPDGPCTGAARSEAAVNRPGDVARLIDEAVRPTG
ncbi:hypothetical protein M2164_008201 [Streptomyces sp. SAI-208]|nr:hypothetical protein [Streptomyces sp. SAI-117]MDH6582175.1 hypothetical protein [Streptomyces sp. SAI-133]MDH6612566.1 hypothetical protein [Streptomyces sp. SAI-208]